MRKWLFLGALAATVLLLAYQIYLDVPLHTAAAPQGIVSFELARTEARSAAILLSWRAPDPSTAPPEPSMLNQLDRIVIGQPRMLVLRAFDQIAFDFLFLLSYALVLSLASLWAAGQGVAPRWGVAFAWLAWVAALADAMENTYMLRQIGGGPAAGPAMGAFVCAALKFTLAIAALEYIAYVAWKIGERPRAVVAQLLALALLIPALLALA